MWKRFPVSAVRARFDGETFSRRGLPGQTARDARCPRSHATEHPTLSVNAAPPGETFRRLSGVPNFRGVETFRRLGEGGGSFRCPAARPPFLSILCAARSPETFRRRCRKLTSGGGGNVSPSRPSALRRLVAPTPKRFIPTGPTGKRFLPRRGAPESTFENVSASLNVSASVELGNVSPSARSPDRRPWETKTFRRRSDPCPVHIFSGKTFRRLFDELADRWRER